MVNICKIPSRLDISVTQITTLMIVTESGYPMGWCFEFTLRGLPLFSYVLMQQGSYSR